MQNMTVFILGIALLSALVDRVDEIDFAALHVYFGDDRFVPADDADRNSGQARAALLDDPDATIIDLCEFKEKSSGP